LTAISNADVNELKQLCDNNYLQLDEDFNTLVMDVMNMFHLVNADDFETARHVYIVLSDVISKLLYH